MRKATHTGQVHTSLLITHVPTIESAGSLDAYEKQEFILPKGVRQGKCYTYEGIFELGFEV